MKEMPVLISFSFYDPAIFPLGLQNLSLTGIPPGLDLSPLAGRGTTFLEDSAQTAKAFRTNLRSTTYRPLSLCLLAGSALSVAEGFRV